ncbi:hypothetical protein E2562_025840 [Oryza meyeriana var. granulata]|uniref:Uncharacterized protein n=1 Tax=Oryza meyeriana var. granulata TaxID=110450 RepID=A0A6G1E1Y8_9ORYZ|nr:hypothetical protein E2562_025840 [Oryza meyeriana var. granulata]
MDLHCRPYRRHFAILCSYCVASNESLLTLLISSGSSVGAAICGIGTEKCGIIGGKGMCGSGIDGIGSGGGGGEEIVELGEVDGEVHVALGAMEASEPMGHIEGGLAEHVGQLDLRGVQALSQRAKCREGGERGAVRDVDSGGGGGGEGG